MNPVRPEDFRHIVFFTGAGMSAESGIPTYRGRGGVWHQYNWEEYACQEAFDADPEKVLRFHEMRRAAILACEPHEGHRVIAALEKNHPDVQVVTQNIDGMHQRAGSRKVTELHGSLWRVRCSRDGVREAPGERYETDRCPDCGAWLRPDVTWFRDRLDPYVLHLADRLVRRCDLFITVGTSAVVWPAAGFPGIAKESGARLVEINLEPTEMSSLYDDTCYGPAGEVLVKLFPG